jgi:hypothetical protein
MYRMGGGGANCSLCPGCPIGKDRPCVLLAGRPSFTHLSAILQTTSIIDANLQDNRAVFQIFIALLRFSFDSTLYMMDLNMCFAYKHTSDII